MTEFDLVVRNARVATAADVFDATSASRMAGSLRSRRGLGGGTQRDRRCRPLGDARRRRRALPSRPADERRLAHGRRLRGGHARRRPAAARPP